MPKNGPERAMGSQDETQKPQHDPEMTQNDPKHFKNGPKWTSILATIDYTFATLALPRTLLNQCVDWIPLMSTYNAYTYAI